MLLRKSYKNHWLFSKRPLTSAAFLVLGICYCSFAIIQQFTCVVKLAESLNGPGFIPGIFQITKCFVFKIRLRYLWGQKYILLLHCMKLNQFSVVAVGIYIAHHYYPQAAKGRKYIATSKCVSSAKLSTVKVKLHCLYFLGALWWIKNLTVCWPTCLKIKVSVLK